MVKKSFNWHEFGMLKWEKVRLISCPTGTWIFHSHKLRLFALCITSKWPQLPKKLLRVPQPESPVPTPQSAINKQHHTQSASHKIRLFKICIACKFSLHKNLYSVKILKFLPRLYHYEYYCIFLSIYLYGYVHTIINLNAK